VVQDEDELVIYYWVLGKNNCVFLCSFSIDSKNDGTPSNETELAIIVNVIESIQFT
jgi:hypothetical protein